MKNGVISSQVIKRLSKYYRLLSDLSAVGVKKISSKTIAEKTGFTASQIRQDLNAFGGFGQQGYGYNTDILICEIGQILRINTHKKAILIGVGNLGRAVALHLEFEASGYSLIGLFDKKESVTGTVVRNTPVRHISRLDEFCRENRPEVAILCIPKEEVPIIADHLIRLGVKGFINFTQYDMSLRYGSVAVENINFWDSLTTLSYKLGE